MTTVRERVLVTGGTGFIGRTLLAAQPPSIAHVTALRREGSEPLSDVPVQWVVSSLTDPTLESALPTGIDVVIHLAQSRLYHEFPEGALDVVEVNVTATARLLEHARRSGAQRFLLASTGAVYRNSSGAVGEDAPLDPPGHYARSKRYAEQLAEAYAGELEVVVMRIFTPYGEHQTRGLVYELAERVAGGRPVSLHGARGPALTPIHVDDAAAAIWGLALAPKLDDFTVVNVAGPELTDVQGVAEQVGRALGRDPAFERVDDGQERGVAGGRRRLDALVPGLQPAGLEAGISRTVAALRG